MQLAYGILVGLLGVSPADTAKSDNEGKIVGKWESVPGGGLPDGATMVMEFTKEMKFTLTVAAEGKVIKTITGTYSLGAGTAVTLDDLSEPISGKKKHLEKVVITDQQLTMRDADGKAVSFKLVKNR